MSSCFESVLNYSFILFHNLRRKKRKSKDEEIERFLDRIHTRDDELD